MGPRSSLKSRRRDSYKAKVSVLSPQRVTQNGLIMRILNESLDKYRLTIQLPVVFRNPITVLQSVKGTEYEPCARALMEFLRNSNTSTYPPKGDHRYDVKLIALIEMFQKNYKILDLLPNWTKDNSMFDQSVLEAFDLLSEIVEERISHPAELELAKEKEIQRLFLENKHMILEIDARKREVQKLKLKRRWKRAVPPPDVLKAQHEVYKKITERESFLKRIKYENIRNVKKLHHAFETKYHGLKRDIQETKNDFQKLKNDHEKDLIQAGHESKKWRIQLQSAIKRYDHAMTEKFKEQVALDFEYRKKEQEMEACMEKYRAVEKNLNDLIEKRDRIWKAEADRFFRTRAARIIQRYWRRSLESKASKIKLRRKAT